jgi:hypothetical protein
MKIYRLAVIAVIFCAQPGARAESATPPPGDHGSTASAPAGHAVDDGTQPGGEPGVGCAHTVEHFCDDLFSKKHKGNVDLKVGDRTIPVRMGDTPNGFDNSFFAFEQAKLGSRHRLPADVAAHLEHDHYFDRLDGYLKIRSMRALSRLQKLGVERTQSELSTIWNQAIEAAALERVEKQHPGFGSRETEPAAWTQDYNDIKDQLGRDVYTAIWKESPAWKKVEHDFQEVREEYLRALREMPGLSDDIRREWIERMSTVRLVIPGADPDGNLEADCPTTAWNAFYRSDNHTVTVCAGAFNSGEFQAVLAHELSHSLGLGRSKFVFWMDSRLGKQMDALRDEVCKNAPLDHCPAGWPALKHDFPDLLQDFDSFHATLPEFLACLQYHHITRQPATQELHQMADGIARQMAGDASDNHKFLKLVERETPLRNGSDEPNIGYLEPCDKRTPIKPEYDPQNSLLLLFTMEYLCDPQGTNSERLTRAANSAQALQTQIEEKVMTMGGPYSDEPTMAQYGYAESAEERWADNLGFHVFARLLEKDPSVLHRRQIFDANIAGFCDPRSMLQAHPNAAQAEKEFSLEAHSLAKQRRQETLIQPIREALACQKDFQGKDCQP